MEPALIEAHDHCGDQQGSHDDHERVAEVRCEVVDGLNFDTPRHIGFEDQWKDFDRGLDESFSPARLLSFEGGHLNGQLCGTFDIGKVFELPSGELGAVAKVCVFGKCVVLPAACIGDGLATPHSGGAVEVEEVAGARTCSVLEDEMAVEQDGFHLGEQAVIPVEVGPACLHHSDSWVGEVMHYLH